jgi:hypothetical protein
MRGRTVLILLVLVVGLVAFIELYEGDLPSSQERAEMEKLALGDLRPDEIEAVEIARQGETTRIERRERTSGEGIDWVLTAPMGGRADSDLVEGLIESLARLEKTRTLAETSRSEAGLDPPRLTVTLFGPLGTSVMEVGSEVPAGASMIVAANGEISVVDGMVWADLARAPGDWRSRRVIHRTEDQITGITVGLGDSQIVFSRRGGDFWIEQPLEDRADAKLTGDLLTEMASMRKSTFVDDQELTLEDLGLEPPIGYVELRSASDDAPSRILWGGSDSSQPERHYAMADGQVFTTETNLQPHLERPAQLWRSLELTSMETFEIDRLEIVQAGESPLTLVRDGADWRRNEDTISFTTVSELLYALTQQKADRIQPEVTSAILDSGSAPALLKVTLEGADRRQTVSFYPSSGGGLSAVVADRRAALWVSDNEFSEVVAKIAEVKAAASVKTDDDEQLQTGASELSSDEQR